MEGADAELLTWEVQQGSGRGGQDIVNTRYGGTSKYKQLENQD